MSGGMKGSFNPKKHQTNKIFNSNEVLKEDSGSNTSDKKVTKFSLKGVLGLGQSVEINKSKPKENFFGLNHLVQEQNILFDQRQRELKQAIEDLRLEIKKLARSAENLNNVEAVKTVNSPIVEINEYQINLLTRIKNFIVDMRQNINEAGLWMEAFASKKKKKNHFWNKVKNKKQGGDQYLFSNEHSVARSVN